MSKPRPKLCPACHEADSLTACGPGVERLAEEAELLFPERARWCCPPTFPAGSRRCARQLDAAAQGDYDIVIGTQLVAKGHNFPLLTLVGVVDADVGLANGDPRAAERTFQLLRQATGRAGRGEQAGPRAAADLAAGASGDRRAAVGRRRALLPRGDRAAAARRPAAVRPAGGDRSSRPRTAARRRRMRARSRAPRMRMPGASAGASRRSAGAARADEISLLGPAEAPIAVLRGRHRFRLAAKAPRGADLQGFLRALLAAAPPPRGGVQGDGRRRSAELSVRLA